MSGEKPARCAKRASKSKSLPALNTTVIASDAVAVFGFSSRLIAITNVVERSRVSAPAQSNYLLYVLGGVNNVRIL